MPGIPIQGPDVNTFLISFWAAFYSGIIYSIITGLVVGFVVLFTQRIADNRKVQREYNRDISVLRERLRYVAQQPDFLNLTSALKSAPLPVIEVMKILSESPIDMWLDNVLNERELLNQLKELQGKYFKFQNASNNFDYKLSSYIRSYNAARDTIAVNDQADRSYFLGKIHNLETSKILDNIDLREGALTRLESSYNSAKSDDDICTQLDYFLNAKKSLAEKFKGLLILLINDRQLYTALTHTKRYLKI